MGIFKQLDVVNDMLGAMGEAGINSLVNAHPLATRGVNILRTSSAREQAKGWWFNTEIVELVPANDGRVILPEDILKIDPVQPTLNYTQRGGYLYRLNTRRGEDPHKFTGPVEVQLVRLLDFEDLPTTAQDYISAAAQLDFVTDMDGDTTKIGELTKQKREAWLVLNSEHIRAVDANLLANPSTLATLGSLRGATGRGLRFR